MSAYDEHFEKVLSFLQTHQSLVDSHLTDFITEDLWTTCLPNKLRKELETLGSGFICKNYWNDIDHSTPKLNEFLKAIDSLALEKCNLVYDARDVPELFSTWGPELQESDLTNCTGKLEFMNEKKSYEVEIMAKVTSALAKFHSSIIVDAGAGKGYLSEQMCQSYGIPVLAIDSSHTTHNGAIRRQNIIKKKSGRPSKLVHYLVHSIDDSTDFSNLAELYFPEWNSKQSLSITGLHTCGSLGQSVVKAFAQSDCIKSLCVVTCCYHLAETSLGGKLKLTKNARMLAQQSVDRVRENNHHLSPTLFYRAVIQVLLNSLGISNFKTGRNAVAEDFVTYAQWVLKKIVPNSNQIPSKDIIEELYRAHENLKWKMEIFQMLRVCLGSVVESAILLDRITYLKASKACSNFALVRLFDPVKSPRCYAIIALK